MLGRDFFAVCFSVLILKGEARAFFKVEEIFKGYAGTCDGAADCLILAPQNKITEIGDAAVWCWQDGMSVNGTVQCYNRENYDLDDIYRLEPLKDRVKVSCVPSGRCDKPEPCLAIIFIREKMIIGNGDLELGRGDCSASEWFYDGSCYFLQTGTYLTDECLQGSRVIVDSIDKLSFLHKLFAEGKTETILIDVRIQEESLFGTYRCDRGSQSYSQVMSAVEDDRLGPMSYFCQRSLITVTQKSGQKFPDLLGKCQQEAQSQKLSCRSGKYCCAYDDIGRLWVACTEVYAVKKCDVGRDVWYCNEKGVFEPDSLVIKGCGCSKVCTYGSICPNTYYWEKNCQNGYASYYCSDKYHLGPRNTSTCCNGDFCSAVDPFLNVWSGCEGSIVSKRTDCPYGTAKSKADVTWRCDKGGFATPTPDYSVCDDCESVCYGKDRTGTTWIICAGHEAFQLCPDGMDGISVWGCRTNATFVSPNPDFSKCTPLWTEDISEMYTKWIYQDRVISAWAWCYNNVTVPSIRKIYLKGSRIEVSCCNENCRKLPQDECNSKLTRSSNTTDTINTTATPSPNQPIPFCQESECAKKRCVETKNDCYLYIEVEIDTLRYDQLGGICSNNKSFLPVAIESLAELKYLNSTAFPFLTSGGITQDGEAQWFGRNSVVDRTLFPEFDSSDCDSIIVRNVTNDSNEYGYWELQDIRSIQGRIPVLCEYVSEPSNHDCENTTGCCAVDEYYNIWLAEPGTTAIEIRTDNADKNLGLWKCGNKAEFETPSPDFEFLPCLTGCYPSQGPSCKDHDTLLRKHEENSDFWNWKGEGDISLCCREHVCIGYDEFSNLWVGCNDTIVSKETGCKGNTQGESEIVSRYCDKSGSFEKEPNYQICSTSCDNTCAGTDQFGGEWFGCPGEIVYAPCPFDMCGNSSWLCQENLQFSGYPDLSQCRPDWVNTVTDLIKGNNDSVVIMDTIANFTRVDCETGFSSILDVVTECVNLFSEQYPNRTSLNVTVFESFTRNYARVLADVATNMSMWSNFLMENRIAYGQHVISLSENVGFSMLKADKDLIYNKTFRNLQSHGLTFSVSYNKTVRGMKFPADDAKSNCSVEVIGESQGTNFASVGLVFSNDVARLMFPKGNTTAKKIINAPVLSFSVASFRDSEIEKVEKVTVSLKFKHEHSARYPNSLVVKRRLHDGESPSPVVESADCYYYGTGDWETTGCEIETTSKEETSCRCVHLSTMSVLMDLHEYKRDPVLEMVSLACSSTTIVSLLLTLSVYFGFECLKSERTTIGKHLCGCLLIGHVMILTIMDKKFLDISDTNCAIFGAAIHYIFMAAFLWMSAEGHHLYRLVVVVFRTDTDYKKMYLMAAYGLPVVIVGATETIGLLKGDQAYGRDEICWLQTGGYTWAFMGPVAFLTSVNLIILIIAMKLAAMAKIGDGRSTLASARTWLKGWFSLSILLGITWLLGLGYIEYNDVLVYAFVITNGLQGLFIFLFRCAFNEQVRTALLRQYRTRTSQNDDSKAMQKSRSGTRTGVITTAHERMKSSGTSLSCDSNDANVDPKLGLRRFEVMESLAKENDAWRLVYQSYRSKIGKERPGRKMLPCEILQKIQEQRSKSSQEFSAKCKNNDVKSSKKEKSESKTEWNNALQESDPPSYLESISLPQENFVQSSLGNSYVGWGQALNFPAFQGARPRIPTILEETESLRSFGGSEKRKNN